MATETWNITTIDGKQYLVVDVAKFRIPLDWDPSSNMFFAVSYPDGGIGNFTALAKGDTGDVPTLNLPITLTELDPADTTPASASFTEVSPDTYTMSLALHRGAKGDDGDTVLLPTDYGTSGQYQAGDYLVVNSALSAFSFTPQRVGDRYVPATIVATPSGNPAYTLCSVAIPPQRFSYRPLVEGFCEITGTNADVKVDLVARLDNATAGNIIGKAVQRAGQYPATHTLSSTPPAGSASGYDLVPPNTSAVIYLRAERVSGGGTFTTSATTTGFSVRVLPIPLSAEA